MKTIPIDLTKSTLSWQAYKPGGSHTGSIQFKTGNILLDDENMPKGGDFCFDMTTIVDNDQKDKLKDMLETHLKSDEFFDVEKYPEAFFTITKTDHTPDADGFYAAVGELDIKGIKGEVSFKAKYEIIDKTIHIQTNTIVVDRTKWNINYGSKNFFKKLTEHIIADNFDVKVEIFVNLV